MDTQSNGQSKVSLLRWVVIGAAALAVATAPGTCFYLYKWITTGNLLHLGEAVALVSVSMVMGGSGAAAYCLVMRSRVKDRWKPFLALLAAMEAYLLAFFPMALIIGLTSPKLNEGIPLGDVRFHLLLNIYGALLCVCAFGIYYAPRIFQIVVVGVLGTFVLLTAAAMSALLFMGPSDLDRWATFLRPVQIVFPVILVGVAGISIVGWVRFFRRSHGEKKSATDS
jgi:hypothetical protein